MTDTEYAGLRMSELSRWIDEGNANRMAVMTREELERELSMSLRIAKAAEEIGEAVSALIGFTGQNPRKGVVNTLQDINKELMDVAITALGAYESINDNPGDALLVLEAAIVMVADRALAAGEPVVEAAIDTEGWPFKGDEMPDEPEPRYRRKPGMCNSSACYFTGEHRHGRQCTAGCECGREG